MSGQEWVPEPADLRGEERPLSPAVGPEPGFAHPDHAAPDPYPADDLGPDGDGDGADGDDDAAPEARPRRVGFRFKMPRFRARRDDSAEAEEGVVEVLTEPDAFDGDAVEEEDGEPAPRRRAFPFRIPSFRRARVETDEDLAPDDDAAPDDADEVGPEDAEPARRRFPGLPLTREARVGIAAALSFLILVTVWVNNKGRAPAPMAIPNPPKTEGPASDEGKLAVAGKGEASKPESKGTGKDDPEEKPEAGVADLHREAPPAADAAIAHNIGAGESPLPSAAPAPIDPATPPAPAEVPPAAPILAANDAPEPAATPAPAPPEAAPAPIDPATAPPPETLANAAPDPVPAATPEIKPAEPAATPPPADAMAALPTLDTNSSMPPLPETTPATPPMPEPGPSPQPMLDPDPAPATPPMPDPAPATPPTLTDLPAEPNAVEPSSMPAPALEPDPAPKPAEPEPEPASEPVRKPAEPEPAVAPTEPPSFAPVPAQRTPPLESVPENPSAASDPAPAAPGNPSAPLGDGWVIIKGGARRVVVSSPLREGPDPASPAEGVGAAAGSIAEGPRPREDIAARDQIEPRLHRVRSRENFWTISRDYYGTGRYYRALWKANAGEVPDIRELYVGTVIRVPPPETLDRSLVDPPPPARVVDKADLPNVSRTSNSEEAEAAAPVVAAPSFPPVRRRGREVENPDEPPARPTYKVRPYETLRSIARDTLGDSRRDREILILNRSILKDASDLAPGQILTLPADAQAGRRGR
ncbi:LysM peptidoglycan-binding domain-containing protein [Tundrisphaera sp. TA3]|uniref:LysM peptidoglycan-binding domain-containing protein n=1 Tax=Tundrisphaera sp. TA3 TaxID=3435775 RepID=UPI003EBAAE06